MPRGEKRAVKLAIALLLVAASSLGFAAHAQTIKVGAVKVAGLSPPFIAQEKGYFAAAGLSAELVWFDAAQPVAVATVSGDVDFGVAAVTAGFYNLAGQGALKIIAAAAHEAPGFHSQAYLTSARADAAGLKSIKDLPGHSFALTGAGAPPVYVVGALVAEKYGFDFKSIKLIPVQTLPNIVTALAGGQADFTVMSPTSGLTPLLQRGDVKLMGWVGDETPWQFAVTFTSTKMANDRPELVKKFLEAYRKGARDIHDAYAGANDARKDGPNAASVTAIIAKYIDQSVADVAAAIPYLDAEARLDSKDIRRQVAWYKSQGLIKDNVDANAIIDERYVVPLPSR